MNIIKARVTKVQRNLYTVLTENGESPAKLKGALYGSDISYPVVGDYVMIKYNPQGESIIDEVCGRTSEFVRPDMSGHAEGYIKTLKNQVLAANFDYVFITASLNQNYNLNRIARYVTITLNTNAKPVVVLTKRDLCEDYQKYIDEVKRLSDKVDVVAISAVTGDGMDELKTYLSAGVTIVLLGSSGVGKSTMVNAIAGNALMETSAIREKDSRGRHTTTHRELIVLPGDVCIIDTPGIRELGLCDVAEGIEDTFDDIVELATQCKFSNCRHETEKGCRIKEALADGSLSQERYNLYSRFTREDRWAKKIAVQRFRKGLK